MELFPAIEYDEGKVPSVSINDSGIIVEVHAAQGLSSGLWHRVGKLTTSSSGIEWGNHSRYDYGSRPRIAINKDGVVVEVHKVQELVPTLWYHVGKVNAHSMTIDWGSSHKYDKGTTPDVALTDDGTVIEVHETNNVFSNDTYYHVGTVDASSKTIKWGPSHRYGEGKTPSVAVNSKGVVVELHGSGQLWYHVGSLQAHNQSISWGDSKKYETGTSPCVAINNRGQIIEVHESEGLLRRLWCNVGNADLSTRTILWSMPNESNASLNYSQGITPAAAITTEGKVVEVHETDHQFKNTLWYQTGTTLV